MYWCCWSLRKPLKRFTNSPFFFPVAVHDTLPYCVLLLFTGTCLQPSLLSRILDLQYMGFNARSKERQQSITSKVSAYDKETFPLTIIRLSLDAAVVPCSLPEPVFVPITFKLCCSSICSDKDVRECQPFVKKSSAIAGCFLPSFSGTSRRPQGPF